MSTAPEPCRTCDGTGYVETAAPDSRVIHHEPCPDQRRLAFGVRRAAFRAGSGLRFIRLPARRTPLVRALVQEYAALRGQREPWQWMPAAEPGQRDYLLGARHALERVAARLGVTDLHAQAAEVMARGAEGT